MTILQTNNGVLKYELIMLEGKQVIKIFSNNSDDSLCLKFIWKECRIFVRPTQAHDNIGMLICCDVNNKKVYHTNYNSLFDTISIDDGIFNWAINTSHMLRFVESNKMGFGSDDFHIICTFNEKDGSANFEVNSEVCR